MIKSAIVSSNSIAEANLLIVNLNMLNKNIFIFVIFIEK